MRKLRFRVFDKDDKTMHICSGSHDSITFMPDGQAIYYNLQNGEGSLNEDSTYILMQFTGLLDKNGKEIYEGDILEWTAEPDTGDLPNHKDNLLHFFDEVIYENGMTTTREGAGEPITFGDLPEIGCVVGNIYENPELLNIGE